MIDPALKLCVSAQCQLLDIGRSTYYYQRQSIESEANLALMEEIDRIYLAHPENGSQMMTRILRRRGCRVNRKRVQRLMQLMGICSLAPQPSTTTPHPAHVKYPYLLRNMRIDHPNQVWASDITYIPFTWIPVVVATPDFQEELQWHRRRIEKGVLRIFNTKLRSERSSLSV